MPSPPNPNPDTHDEPSTWTNTLSSAFTSCSSCLPCLRKIPSDDSLHNHTPSHTPALYANTINTVPRARPDELQGLLQASSSTSTTSSLGWSDTDNDDDRFSLHTNPGTNPRRKRKPKKKRHGKITLFGFNLFGRRAQQEEEEGKVKLDEETGDALYRDTSTSALALPGDDEPYRDEPVQQAKGKGKRNKFDADAAPLSSARIAELAASASASVASSPRLSQMNPISPPDSPSSTFPIPPSRESDDEYTLDDNPSVRTGGHTRTHSSFLFESSSPPQSPSSFNDDQSTPKSKSKKKKSSSTSKADKNAIKTQLAQLERLKAQGTLPESNNGIEFEGFQGSGSAAPPLSQGIVARRSVGTRSTSSSGSSHSRSRAKTGTTGLTSPSPPTSPFSGVPTETAVTTPSAFGDQEAEEEVEADLDGAMYSGPRRKGYIPGGGASRSSGSRSHGRGSESRHARSDSRSSGGWVQYAQYPASPGGLGGPSPLGFHLEQERGLEEGSRKTKRERKGTSSSGTRSNQSNSVVVSPLSPSFSQDGLTSPPPPPPARDAFPSSGLGKSTFPRAGFGQASFPSTGLGKTTGGGLKASDMAKMLRRGDEFEGF